jgi:hypothetical protein
MALPIHRTLLAHLVILHERGGSGELDIHGNLLVEPVKAKLAGTPLDWLKLVSMGYLAGERGKLILTEEGRELAETGLRGRIRDSSGGDATRIR